VRLAQFGHRHTAFRLTQDLGFCISRHRHLNPIMYPADKTLIPQPLAFGGITLQSHHFRSGEMWEITLDRSVLHYNPQLRQSALGSETSLQAMKHWNKRKPALFWKQPYHIEGCGFALCCSK
jgi:hypothetical protein